MSFLIVKKFGEQGCVALQICIGKDLVKLRNRMENMCGDDLQFVTISRPSAYGEYEPYYMVDSKENFEKEIMKRWC